MDAVHMGWSVDPVNHGELYGDQGEHNNWAKCDSSNLWPTARTDQR